MNYKVLIFIVFVSLVGCEALKLPKQKAEESLFTIGESQYDKDEFIYVYSKNNLNEDSIFSREDVEDYFDLFVKFKLKVKEAKAQGLDQTASFKSEFEGYRKQLAKPYLTESKVTDDLVKETYERLKTEINAAHILLRLDPQAAPDDTLKVYNRAMELRQEILEGKDFYTMAGQYSADPSAKKNGGNLGYFSALQMVYPFESACYNTEVNDITYPVRTRFGYHIIKILDKRPSQGKVQVAHIMIRSNAGMPQEAQNAHQEKINEIYKKLQNGEDWNVLCSQFSEDLGSSKKGGQLPWIGTGNVDPTFEAAAFALTEPGDLSPPFLTPYGWHIVKLGEKKGLQPFDEMKEELTQKIQKDSRSALGDEILVKRLKSDNNFQLSDSIKTKALSQFDSSLVIGNWNFDKMDEILQATLFSLQGQPIKVDSFFNYVMHNQRKKSGELETIANNYYDNFELEVLKSYEESQLPEKYIDYKMILNEYYEGILLFEIMDNNVWSKAMSDTVGLKKFYNDNVEKYQFQERIKGTIIDAANHSYLDSIKHRKLGENYILESIKWGAGENKQEFSKLDGWIEQILAGNANKILIRSEADNEKALSSIKEYMSLKKMADSVLIFENGKFTELNLLSANIESLAPVLNKDNPLAVQIHKGMFEEAEHEVLGEVVWEPGVSVEVQHDGRVALVEIEDILPPSAKPFEQIKGLVISDYQNYLDENWILELKEKYPVTVNDNVFETSINEIKNK